MTHQVDLILTLTGALTAAVILGFITEKLKLSSIVGYLLAGIAVGPFTPGFVANHELASQSAEIGVILLMFGVGLHFHVKDLMEAHGTIGGALMIGSILISLGLAVFMAFRVPLMLYFDLLDGKVESKEGRVVAREEQINRANGRDPIEKYFFSLRYLNMPVNLAAYRALEAGSIYIVYLLPRSESLVSIEPKLDDGAVPVTSRESRHTSEESPSPSTRAS